LKVVDGWLETLGQTRSDVNNLLTHPMATANFLPDGHVRKPSCEKESANEAVPTSAMEVLELLRSRVRI
jgi:hypothetical protein